MVGREKASGFGLYEAAADVQRQRGSDPFPAVGPW